MELDGTKAPQTVASFLGLARSGYWNDSPCHRLVTSGIFVLQCGDPTGTGSGGPGYGFGVENAPKDDQFPAGTLAMARTSDPNSNGGQFFIVYKQTELPGPHRLLHLRQGHRRHGYRGQDRRRGSRAGRPVRQHGAPPTDQHPQGCCHREEGLTSCPSRPPPPSRPTRPRRPRPLPAPGCSPGCPGRLPRARSPGAPGAQPRRAGRPARPRRSARLRVRPGRRRRHGLRPHRRG